MTGVGAFLPNQLVRSLPDTGHKLDGGLAP